MENVLAELSTGMVHGRFIVAVVDGTDYNEIPDVIPATGKITFKASVPYVPVYQTASGPVTILKSPIVGILDSEGYLSTPHPNTGEPLYRGVKLFATDDPSMGVVDWTWSVEYKLDSVAPGMAFVPPHNFQLATDSVYDLTTGVKVPSTPGYGIPQAEAAALRAESIAAKLNADAEAGKFGHPGLVVIHHGEDAVVSRPEGIAWVLWIGTARPDNMLDYDMWDNS